MWYNKNIFGLCPHSWQIAVKPWVKEIFVMLIRWLNGALDSFRMGIVPREIHPVTVNIGLKLWASPPFRLSAQQPAFHQRWTHFLKLSLSPQSFTDPWILCGSHAFSLQILPSLWTVPLALSLHVNVLWLLQWKQTSFLLILWIQVKARLFTF